MKKKVLSILLTFCIILTLIPMGVFAADTDISIEASTTLVGEGEDFVINLAIPAISDKAYSASFKIGYNPTIFEIGEFLPSQIGGTVPTKNVNTSEGYISCTYLPSSGENELDFSSSFTISANVTVKNSVVAGEYDFRILSDDTFIKHVGEDGYTETELITIPADPKVTVTVTKAPELITNAPLTYNISDVVLDADKTEADLTSVLQTNLFPQTGNYSKGLYSNTGIAYKKSEASFENIYSGSLSYNEKLDPSKEYYFRTEVTAAGGYFFDESTQVTVNGEPVESKNINGYGRIVVYFKAPTYSVAVNGGNADDPSTRSEYIKNQEVAITLDENNIPEGRIFEKWTFSSEVNFASGFDATMTETTFIMPAENVAVTATYKDLESISGAVVDVGGTYTYDGTAQEPQASNITVTLGGITLTKDVDYEITSYSNNTNAGTATVTVSGIGEYTGTATGTFTINKADAPSGIKADFSVLHSNKELQNVSIADFDLPDDIASAKFTGSPSDKSDTNNLIYSYDNASFKLADGVNAGNKGQTANWTVTIESTNHKDITATVTVTIVDKKAGKVEWSEFDPSREYDGSPITFSVESDPISVRDEKNVLLSDATLGFTWYKDGAQLLGAPTDVGTYNLKAVIDHAEYAGEATKEVTILAKELAITGVTAVDRPYAEGNDNVDLDVNEAALVGVINGDINNVSLKSDSATGTMENANVGNDKVVTVTGFALDGDRAFNYSLSQPEGITVNIAKADPTVVFPTGLTITFGQTFNNISLTQPSNGIFTWSNVDTKPESVGSYGYPMIFTPQDQVNYNSLTSDVTVTVNKAAAHAIADQPVSLKYSVTGEQSKSVAGLMPLDAGTLTYAKGTASQTGSVTISSWDVDSSSGQVTFTLSGGADTNTVTLPVIITSTNYGDSTVNIVITLTAKDPQATLTITGGNKEMVYGDTLTLTTTGGSGDGQITYSVTSGTGTASVVGNVLEATQAGTVTVTATKAEDSNYNEATSASVTITINKATPEGTPAFTAITTTGKTLGDANLTKGSITLDGTISWDLGNAEEVKANASYEWTFEPNDTTNYNNLTGSIKVWAQSTGGSGGSGSSGGGSVPIQTAPAANGAVSVSYTTSGGTATLSMPTSKVNDIIEKSKDGEVVIDLSKVGGATAASLPKTALEAFEDAGLDVTIKLPTGTITLDKDAAASVAGQAAGGNLSLELKPVAASALTEAQKEVVNTGDIVLDINISSGTKKITGFGGSLTVSVPYTGPQPVAVWYLNDKGELEKLNCIFKDGMVSFSTDHLSLYVVGKDETVTEDKWVNPFTDVKEGTWYYDAVRYVYGNGLMVGTGKTTFGTNGNTTRAMIVTILYRLESTPKAGANPFTDVADGMYYTNAIAWAAENKIVSGYGNGKFGPEDSITREQMAAILYRYAEFKGYDVSAKTDLSKYADSGEVSSWARTAMAWANAEKLINGDNIKLMPTGSAERCQVAAILHRFIENIVK